MAGESESGEEKTEEPTSRRLEKAREQGDMPRSQDLGGSIVVLVVCLAIYMLGGQMAGDLESLLTAGLSFSNAELTQGIDLPARLGSQVMRGFWLFRWLLVLSVVAALAAALLNGGISFSGSAAGLKFDRLNPLNGLKRMFGSAGWVSVGRNTVKFLGVGVVLGAVLWSQRERLLEVARYPLETMIASGASLALYVFLMISLVIAGLGVADVPLQRWSFMRRMRMTRQEIRDEMKDSDGRPEVKQRIRRRQREIGRSRMLQRVQDADVVIVNPTEFAVALVYDEQRSSVPIVLAKGRGEIAAAIKRRASEAAVPVVEAPPLARALYYSGEINQVIHEGLYRAVAAVLAYVYQASALAADLSQSKPAVPPVPDELLFDEEGRPMRGAQ
jgi:flagellar biosynthetic protein FlhB